MAFYQEQNQYFETFFLSESECEKWNENSEFDSEYEPGYYYWFSMPGCYPDSDAFGPYETEELAYDAAVEFIND
jgi:hypothetical protein